MKNYDKYLQQIKVPKKKEKYFDLDLSETKTSHYLFYNQNNFNSYLYSLHAIKKYSPSHLKYSRKIELQSNNNTYFFNISDIHVEIDFTLLGVNECNIFQELYVHIEKYVTQQKVYYICMNFDNIKKELKNILQFYERQEYQIYIY